MADTQKSFSQIRAQVTDIAKLYLRLARLSLAEKVTVFLTAAVCAIGTFVLAVIFFFFLAFAIAHWLEPAIGIAWAYALISFVFLIMIVLLFVLRKPLIMNPISRFISRLFLS